MNEADLICRGHMTTEYGDVKTYLIEDSNGINYLSIMKLKKLLQERLVKNVELIENEIKYSIASSEYISRLISKLLLVGGANTEVIKTDCNHKIYKARLSKDYTLAVIPDDVKEVGIDKTSTSEIRSVFHDCTGLLKVVGGNGLKSTQHLFALCNVELDLSEFNTANVEDMRNMFSCYHANNLDLSNLLTANVETTSQMFNYCNINNLNLSGMRLPKVVDMDRMFIGCETSRIDLSTINVKDVELMGFIFAHCNVNEIVLDNFNATKVHDMTGAFFESEIRNIDLSSFYAPKLSSVQLMFCKAKIPVLDLKLIDISQADNLYSMFACCKASKIDISSFKVAPNVNMYNIFNSIRRDTEVIMSDNRLIKAYWGNYYE